MRPQASEFARNQLCPRCNKASCNHWTPREPVMPSYLRDNEQPKDKDKEIDITSLKETLGI